MGKFSNLTTTEFFNIFHDRYKERFGPGGWMDEFRRISRAIREQTDACYWYNIDIPNDEEANRKLAAFLEKLDEED